MAITVSLLQKFSIEYRRWSQLEKLDWVLNIESEGEILFTNKEMHISIRKKYEEMLKKYSFSEKITKKVGYFYKMYMYIY